MLMKYEPPINRRILLTHNKLCDLAVIGGGLAGVCCALTAARAGIKVTLIQDRPVLGGNASSEVRLWVLGATSHMNNNNRWSREGGVLDEIMVENLYRNPEGNPLIFDTILLEKVVSEPRITLLLNTAVYEVRKNDADHIQAVCAFCSQNSSMYEIEAPYFCDASGDGVVGFLAGAAFRMGAESRHEFGEEFAPDEEYGNLLGHSIYFYSKDLGRPVRFVPPDFALNDITQIPRFQSFNAQEDGCRLWWIEYGGRLDTVHDTEKIKWELWKIVYGVWNYIKNSGQFPEAETLTLEWVGHIPGKRESRRFEGDYLLRQQDIVEQRQHTDAVAFGGWAIDLHPADGIFSERPGCNQWHAAGVYQIPYRCLYSRNVANLFLAGRCISVTHVAFGSTRVMATGAHAAQAVGMAAALCVRENLLPADLTTPERMAELQRELLRRGQYIPGLRLADPADQAQTATIQASSSLQLSSLPPDGPLVPLTNSLAQLLPLSQGPAPRFVLQVHADKPTTLRLELRASSRAGNFTPDVALATRTTELVRGEQRVAVDFELEIEQPRYVFLCLLQNEQVSVQCSNLRVTGLLTVRHNGMQEPPEGIGIESFELWCPPRRPGGQNLALEIEPPLTCFSPANVTNGLTRPINAPNAWVADLNDVTPVLTLQWEEPRQIGRIELCFDTDFDHAMETVLRGHPEHVIPFCVTHYRLYDGANQLLASCDNNHQTRQTIQLNKPITTDTLTLQVQATQSHVPAAVFEIRCYPA